MGRNPIAVSFVELFLRTMFEFMDDMERHHVTHGDIHSGNVLVEDRSEQLGREQYAFRITDFGVTRATSDRPARDDYDQVALVLRELLEKVNYQAATARERFAFNCLNDSFLARHLTERDTTRDPLARRPRELHAELLRIGERFEAQQGPMIRPQLATLYDYPSCEQMGEAHDLLKALYSDAFLGLPEIEGSRSNLVLTGPRGCGKSMVFKTLSLRHRTLVQDDSPDSVAHVGIYYRCADLWSVFPRYVLPEREGGYDIPVHFLTSTLICEALTALENWGIRHFKDEFSQKQPSVTAALWDILEEELESSAPAEPGANTFAAVCFRLQSERRRAAKKQRFVNDPTHPMRHFFGPSTLLRVCDVLRNGLPFIGDRPFFFFIDDYSTPKISEDLQKNLNRLLMQRTSHCFFKLSTESPVSYVRADIDGKAYVERREFTLLNLGMVYLTAPDSAKLQFIGDVLRRRFENIAGFPASELRQLIGTRHAPSHNEVAQAIRRGEQQELWGHETLGDLCSGDIFYIINLVARMVSEAGGGAKLSDAGGSPMIDPALQKRVIRAEAGSFLSSLRAIPNGEHLVQVVTAFGNVAHSYLMYRDSKNEEGRPPHLASRIEPYEELDLTEEARAVYDDLLRYSVFIEDPRGKSRRGKVVPRLYLRRSLLPHFNLTFSKRDSVELEPDEVERLLQQPKAFEEGKRLRKPEPAVDDRQQQLWDREGAGTSDT